MSHDSYSAHGFVPGVLSVYAFRLTPNVGADAEHVDDDVQDQHDDQADLEQGEPGVQLHQANS